MKLSAWRNSLGLILWGLAVFCPPAVCADEIVAVLSADLKPYQEALSGLQQELGHPLSVLKLTDHKISIPPGTQIIIAIGGEAATQNYPRDVALVYCVAPGILVSVNERKAPTAKIYMTPSADSVLDHLQMFQPQLKSLGIIALSESRDEFNTRMSALGKTSQINVLIEKMHSSTELPDRLRSLQSHIDALWIPPDPRLITRQNFNLIKEFCRSNRIAFYVPTDELVDQGATASVAVSFEEMGRTAAQTVKELLQGPLKNGKIYPQKARVALNLSAAAASGLTFSHDQLQKIDKVIP